MNGQTREHQYKIPGSRNQSKKAWAVFAVAAFTLIVIGLTLLLITGVIKIGHTRLKSIVMTNRIDEQTMRPEKSSKTFSGNENRIYCCAEATAFDDTVVRVEWRIGNRLIREQIARFSEVVGSIPAKCLTGTGNVAFYLNRPGGGWPKGYYHVNFQLGDAEPGKVSFAIGEKEYEGSIDLNTYEDPRGLFSIDVPSSWLSADPQTLGGGISGFISNGNNEYPPRIEITATDFENVSTDYLNSILKSKNIADAELFDSYSLIDNDGARRDFKWTYTEEDKIYELHTIQLVVQGEQAVYGLNLHSAAADYDDNLPIFNAIISSFQVHDNQ